MLDIEVENSADYVVCRPVGEHDAYTVGQFRERLAELAASPRLLIDLSSVPFMDSAGLGALMLVQRRAAERKQVVVLRNVNEELRFLLVLTKLDDLFQLESGQV